MDQPIRVLLVEDDQNDAELISLSLRDADCDARVERVDSQEQMEKTLRTKEFDIILSDYTMPTFSGPAALETLRQSGLDLPFVVVSGTISLERAISMMKNGASDFVLKDQLVRLPPVVLREVKESKNRIEKRTAEERYKQIVETAHEGIALLRPDGKVLFANTFLAKLFKLSPEDMTGRDIFEFLWDKKEENFSSTLKDTDVNKKRFSNLDFKFQRSDGSELWAMVSLSPVLERKQRQTLIMMSDVTQRKKDEEEKRWLLGELQSALRARDEFLSVASHELKTPLTPLILQMDLLREFLLSGPQKNWDKDEIFKALKLMMEHLNKLKVLVEDLLEVTRFRAGKFNVKKEKSNLSALIKNVLDKFGLQLKKANCEVNFKAPNELYGEFDPIQMEVVVTNLLNNAMKYGHDRPIEIELEGNDKTMRFSIKDLGIGIEKVDQERIFNRFERAASHTHYGGLGLGLYISDHIVKAHRGSIKIESEKKHGAKFIVEFPRFKRSAPSGELQGFQNQDQDISKDSLPL